MSFDYRELQEYRKRIELLRKDLPRIEEELIIGEGDYAVKQTKIICKNDSPDIVNTGAYRNSWHTGNKALTFDGHDNHDGSRPRKVGKKFLIDVYNNLDYASHLEYGFRAHFVPGHWEGKTFVYSPNDPAGGMYVGKPGSYVRGHFVLRRAKHRVKNTQTARVTRKWNEILKKYCLK